MKYFVTVIAVITSVFLIQGCSSSPSGSGKSSNPPTLDAVIDYSPTTPETNAEVTMDAGNSKDDQNIGYDIQWSLTTKPANSTVTFSNTTQSKMKFTPDVAGDYEVKLEIENSSEGVTDDATKVLSVISSESTVELEGDINTDSTLTDIFTDPSVPDYLVVGDLDVHAKLTVDPGVVIHFEENLGLKVATDGILSAVGTSGNGIIFTGASQSTNGFWKGINIHSNTVENAIKYAEISYGGSKSAGTYFEAANLTIDQAKVQLANTKISNSGMFGIQTRRSGSEFAMENMEFSSNDDEHAYVHISQLGYFDSGSSFDGGYVEAFGGSTKANMDISVLNGAKYSILDHVGFDHVVTIDAGTEIEFIADAGIKVGNNGVIKAVGEANNKIVFTGTVKTPGAWRGIFVGSPSVENIFKHVEISYGGSTNMATYFGKTNMVIDRAQVELDNVSITGSAGYGIQTRRNGSAFTVSNASFDNNQDSHMLIHPTQVDFVDNQTNFNGGDVEVYGGDTEATGSETWSNLNNGTYYFSSSVSIEKDVTIEAGTLFEMGTDVRLLVSGGNDQGVIKAIGTSSNPITFTGRSKAKGAWRGILISSGSVDNEMDHVLIEYGGSSDLATYMPAGNLGIYNKAYLTISNADIENSDNYGIMLRESRSATMGGSNISYSNNTNDDFYDY
ncbi:hypothetical protein [Fodinibius halophilus]|uniref:PKD domain-containing protein n=1 Tax=Fodinibius halophilus TaxID=1736908 RepID=A0A6M1TE96_9BACT|nr:hypothetical protein [Fodinibius halophilus]NGP87000.1 hypothetical protein [Fodinibius halophilus]